jgi:hypothetical protein
MDSKLLADGHSVCGTAPATATMLREKISGIL